MRVNRCIVLVAALLVSWPFSLDAQHSWPTAPRDTRLFPSAVDQVRGTPDLIVNALELGSENEDARRANRKRNIIRGAIFGGVLVGGGMTVYTVATTRGCSERLVCVAGYSIVFLMTATAGSVLGGFMGLMMS